MPSPGDLPDPGIEPGSPALQADSLLIELRGKPPFYLNHPFAGPISTYSHVEIRGVRTLTHQFCRDTILPITASDVAEDACDLQEEMPHGAPCGGAPACCPSCGLFPCALSSPPRAYVHVTSGSGSAWDSVQPAEIPFPFHLQSWQFHSSVVTPL